MGQGTGDQSPTTALAKLSFGTNENSPDGTSLGEPEWPKPVCTYRSVSCERDWLSVNEDSKVEQGEQVVPRRVDDVVERALPIRTFGLTKLSCKPYRGTEGVVPTPLDSLPQVRDILRNILLKLIVIYAPYHDWFVSWKCKL